MSRFFEYFIFFAILILLQVFLFNNLTFSAYFTPLIYTAFIVILPISTPAIGLLLLGLITGVIVDLLMGMSGLNTIATLAVSFLRPVIINVTLGKDIQKVKDTLLPNISSNGRWLLYVAILVTTHSLILFLFEAASWKLISFTMLRTLCSSVSTIILILFIGKIYPLNNSSH